jgi:hypothetical protein
MAQVSKKKEGRRVMERRRTYCLHSARVLLPEFARRPRLSPSSACSLPAGHYLMRCLHGQVRVRQLQQAHGWRDPRSPLLFAGLLGVPREHRHSLHRNHDPFLLWHQYFTLQQHDFPIGITILVFSADDWPLYACCLAKLDRQKSTRKKT